MVKLRRYCPWNGYCKCGLTGWCFIVLTLNNQFAENKNFSNGCANEFHTELSQSLLQISGHRKPSQLEVMCGVMYAPKNSVNGW